MKVLDWVETQVQLSSLNLQKHKLHLLGRNTSNLKIEQKQGESFKLGKNTNSIEEHNLKIYNIL